jgi:serine phosphatase RsbU (regulator of sigma subunit)
MAAPTEIRCEKTSLDCETWVELHVQRSLEFVRVKLEELMAHVFEGCSFVLVTYSGEEGWVRVEARSSGLQLEHGQLLAESALPSELAVREPLRFQGSEIGYLLASAEPDPQRAPILLRHAAVAIVQADKNGQVQDSLAVQACALDAMKSAVGLFGESDVDRMCVGFLQMAMEASFAEAGAVFLAPADPSMPDGNRLELQHCFAMPETMLNELRTKDGGLFVDTLLRQRTVLAERGEDGSLGQLDPVETPLYIRSYFSMRLDYEGKPQGVLLLLNVPEQLTHDSGEVSALQHLTLLGGALFRRKFLEDEEIERRKLAAEITLAGRLQQGLQPTEAPNCTGLRFAWRSDSARAVGGDYIDLIEEDDGGVQAILADVSGHGVSSGLLMTSFRSAYRVLVDEGLPDDKLEMMNWTMCRDVGDSGMFITAAAVMIDTDQRSVSFASAGHNPVWLFRAATGDFEVLDASGPPLGLFGGVSYEGEAMLLGDGDLIILYSDGIVEAQGEELASDEDGMYGEERLQELIRAHAAGHPDEMLEAIYQSVQEFTGRQVQEDDTSLLIIQAVPFEA